MNPEISVITPTRNRASTLHRVFKSLEKQTFKNFEWIVCDDASRDETIELLKKYKKKAKFNIRIFYHKIRAGKPKIDELYFNGKTIKVIALKDGSKKIVLGDGNLMKECQKKVKNICNYFKVFKS